MVPDMVVCSEFPASPFASALCQGGIEKAGDVSESYRAPQCFVLSSDALQHDCSSISLSKRKVQNWLRSGSDHTHHSEESDNEEGAALNNREYKKYIDSPGNKNDAASDASSETEACAPPSTWGSDTEADIFRLDWELPNFPASLPRLPKLKIPKSALCPPLRELTVSNKS